MEIPIPPVSFFRSESGILTAVVQDEYSDSQRTAWQTGSTTLTHWYLSRARGYEGLLRQLHCSRNDLQISLGRNVLPRDEDIKGMYDMIQENIVRIVRTYCFSVGIIPWLKEEIEDDLYAQVPLSDWRDRDEVILLRAARSIFKVIRENLVEPSNFRRECEAVSQFDASKQHVMVLPNETLDWHPRNERSAPLKRCIRRRLHATTASIVSYIIPIDVTCSGGRNVFKFWAELEQEVHTICEMALNLALALKLSALSFEFRSIPTGTPITRTEDTDFEVVEYMEASTYEDFINCEVATTIFPALLRSQRLDSRPTVVLSRARIIGYEGPQVVLSPRPTHNGYDFARVRHEAIETNQHEHYTNASVFTKSRNVGRRYIAGEL